jgi:hypothetical protein
MSILSNEQLRILDKLLWDHEIHITCENEKKSYMLHSDYDKPVQLKKATVDKLKQLGLIKLKSKSDNTEIWR